MINKNKIVNILLKLLTLSLKLQTSYFHMPQRVPELFYFTGMQTFIAKIVQSSFHRNSMERK